MTRMRNDYGGDVARVKAFMRDTKDQPLEPLYAVQRTSIRTFAVCGVVLGLILVWGLVS